MARFRDSQRSKVYAWERFLPDGPPMTMEECADLIARATALYSSVGPPRLKDGRGTRIARGGAWTINLPKWARTARTVLHETAHCICWRRLGPHAHAAHGPEFVAVFLDLYERFVDSGLSRADWAETARQRGVKIGRGERVPQPINTGHVGRRIRVVKGYGRVPLMEDPPPPLLSDPLQWRTVAMVAFGGADGYRTVWEDEAKSRAASYALLLGGNGIMPVMTKRSETGSGSTYPYVYLVVVQQRFYEKAMRVLRRPQQLAAKPPETQS